jgi:hypothetical protein
VKDEIEKQIGDKEKITLNAAWNPKWNPGTDHGH